MNKCQRGGGYNISVFLLLIGENQSLPLGFGRSNNLVNLLFFTFDI